jgi:large subunit ribosomal protein L13
MNLQRDVLIDADGLILGRMASYIAKLLRYGYNVYVVNAEKAVISGDPQMVKGSYALWLEIKTLRNPYKWSPRRPRNPIAIVKYSVRNMLPKDPFKKILLLKRLKVYVGYPEEVRKLKLQPVDIPDAKAERLRRKYVTVGEVARHLGWRGKV